MGNIKIAFLSNFTIEPIKIHLEEALSSIEVEPEFYFAPYDQYLQEILNQESELYKLNPTITILALSLEQLFGDFYYWPFGLNYKDRLEKIKDAISFIKDLADKFRKNLNSILLIHNFIIPNFTPLGIADSKEKLGIKGLVSNLNSYLVESFIEDRQIFIVDLEGVASHLGKRFARDEKMFYLAKMELSGDLLSGLSKEYLRYIMPILGLNKKCIVLDLDNTLWGGIVGEDGFDAIKLDNSPPGNTYMVFQKIILNFYKRGIILAINSKNNFEDAFNVIKNHPYMILREEHFASMQINWRDKITNMKEIARELNIGLDSMVFIDDDPRERMLMREMLPEVETLEMPKDSALYAKTLIENSFLFDSFSLTEEDKKRSKLYAQERQRKDLKSSCSSIEEFLFSLDIKAKIEEVNNFTLPRAAQLTQRTNQFNLTTRRYTEEDLHDFCNSGDYLLWTLRIEDKFGDSGIVGLAIVDKKEEPYSLSVFLISCRVLGKGVETAFLAWILQDLKCLRAKRVLGEYISTKKNMQVKDFYQKHGFKKIKKMDGHSIWQIELERHKIKSPEWIKII